MTPIEYRTGDLFAALDDCHLNTTIYVPHVCNNVGRWGAGFTAALSRRWPRLRKDFADMGDTRLGDYMEVILGDKPTVVVANMIAQDGVGTGERRLRYDALARCMESVARSAGQWHVPVHIWCPMFGAGLAGGNFAFVEELIVDCWTRRGLRVTVYRLEGKE